MAFVSVRPRGWCRSCPSTAVRPTPLCLLEPLTGWTPQPGPTEGSLSQVTLRSCPQVLANLQRPLGRVCRTPSRGVLSSVSRTWRLEGPGACVLSSQLFFFLLKTAFVSKNRGEA